MPSKVNDNVKTNHQRVTEGFEVLTSILAPWVAQELQTCFGDEWWDHGVLGILHQHNKRNLPLSGDDDDLIQALDAARCLVLMDVQWSDVFRRKLGREHRTWIKELAETRNKWAHKGLLDISDEDAWRALDTMTRLVEPMDEEAAEKLRGFARIVRYGTDGPSTSVSGLKDSQTGAETGLSTNNGSVEGVLTAVPRQGLRPWREVVRPHPDVAAGRYRQAEFAADLSQVARGTAEVEYQDPVEFFARTYMTDGIRGLLLQALRRIGGNGGEPVIQLKTAFGGGKTHSLLALYHLLRGRVPLQRVPPLGELIQEAGLDDVPRTRVAVVVGTALNPAKERRPPNLQGITIRTLWGEIGAQLAEQTGNRKLYDHVRNADRKGVPPGSEAMRELFDACGPCLVLIDELVAYARKIHGVTGLPAGSFDAVQSFVQELTEAVRASKNSVLVATIPESDIEIGGEAGQETLARIEHTFGRMEAIWKPVGSEEGFEVVRRRLFLPLDDVRARDDVCRAFSSLYRDNGSDFPSECREARYLERLKACYPIHPEVFDRLYADWSTLERFQRTRGVLRLMAAVIHDLWARNDASLLITPGTIGLDDAGVREELVRYLPEGWTPVLESDVDGQNSGPRQVDRNNSRFGQSMAARRVARAVFLGSAPHVVQQQVRGVEDVRVRLATVQPGEQVAVFNDALSQLSDRLTYLYRQDRRYWYDTRPNLRRTVDDRAQQLAEDLVESEIEKRVRDAARKRSGEVAGVHVCPKTTGDVPDDQETRLVILIPSNTHKRGDGDSKALAAANAILAERGTAPRQHRNMLVMLAADQEAMDGLRQAVRHFLAWQSVVQDKEALNLDAHQRQEAADGARKSDQDVGIRFDETWRWLLAPIQTVTDGEVGELEWEVSRTAGNGGSAVTGAVRRFASSEQVIALWSPALLKMELDRWFWTERDHVSVRQVWDAFTSYCYLPRLRDRNVFTDAVREGVSGGQYFGYASGVSEDGRYAGLALGTSTAIHVDQASVLVKPHAARAQLDECEKPPVTPQPPSPAPEPQPGGTQPTPKPPEGPEPVRFHGTVELDPDRAGRDMGKIAEEILQHLTTQRGGKVTVTVEIDAEVPEGLSEGDRRVIGENCQVLRFRNHGFEKA